MFTSSITSMLGAERVRQLSDAEARVLRAVNEAPSRTSWVMYGPISLESRDELGAAEELSRRLQQADPKGDWFFVTAALPDGRRIGYACDMFRASHRVSDADIVAFLFFDLHTLLGSWWLSHLWRAADLAQTAGRSLGHWEVLPAAACARSLLEGAAAFVVEGGQLLEAWREFKRAGSPSIAEVGTFRDQFQRLLLQAHMGSRVRELLIRTQSSQLKRKSVSSFLSEFARRSDKDVRGLYDWLCDAVHPSFGFGTVYVATRGIHQIGGTVAADLARRTDSAETNIPKIDPTVAWAAADAVVLSIDEFLRESPRIRWLLDDIGLTTGAAYGSTVPFLGSAARPQDKDPCPCQSGKHFEECVHSWGAEAVAPQLNA